MFFQTKYREIPGGVCAAQGFTAAGIYCGIRRNKQKKDLALVSADVPCAAAGVYTQNKVKGAPLTVTRENISNGYARAMIVNSGIANTCMDDGIEKAKAMCEIAAAKLGIDPSDVIVASTGVIGQPLPIEPIAGAMDALCSSLSPHGGLDAATAIMTTDKKAKQFALEVEIGGKPCHIGGMSKGSGMIHPNMATMLCFLTTDTAISPEMLDKALRIAVDDTFNMVSIDGDTSTNDMVTILASGKAGNPAITADGPELDLFADALRELCTYLSTEVARDGEGATKLLVCKVKNADTRQTARECAKSVIRSSLVKTAMFGADANWGRVLCALGYAGCEIDPDKIDVAFESRMGRVLVCKLGKGVVFSEVEAKQLLLEDEIVIDVDLHLGNECAQAYGCDLTYDYVKINGDYRT